MSVEAISAARKLKLPPRDKFVLIALADYANDQGEAWPGQGTLSEWTSYDRSTVNAALNALEKAGLIASRQLYRDDGGRSVKVYRLAFLNTPHVANANKGHVGQSNKGHVADANNPPVGETDKGMLPTPTTPRSPRQQPHVAQANNKNHQEGTTNKEPRATRARKDPKKTKPPTPKLGDFDASKIALPDHVTPDVWASFVRHRNQKRKPLTEESTREILQLLDQHPLDADKMLRQTIAASWTRVFPLDKPRDGPRTGPAAEAWNHILDAARRGKPPDDLDDQARAALKAIGGWSAVAYCPEPYLAQRRAKFLDAYDDGKRTKDAA